MRALQTIDPVPNRLFDSKERSERENERENEKGNEKGNELFDSIRLVHEWLCAQFYPAYAVSRSLWRVFIGSALRSTVCYALTEIEAHQSRWWMRCIWWTRIWYQEYDLTNYDLERYLDDDCRDNHENPVDRADFILSEGWFLVLVVHAVVWSGDVREVIF